MSFNDSHRLMKVRENRKEDRESLFFSLGKGVCATAGRKRRALKTILHSSSTGLRG